ncbi:MAG: DUF5058 family protein [Clostridia bacterium]|nr:DUF5058 family protein [Clostridia bacterium]
MEFHVNHWALFLIVGIIIAVVLAQSVVFLMRAVKRARAIGIDNTVIRKTISSSAIFTIAPAISILIGVVTLSKSLGLALPWLRLSVIGSLSYETVAAGNALNGLGLGTGEQIQSATAFVTVLWVMTLGIIIGLIFVPLLTKRIQGGMKKIENRDKKWGEIFTNSMFLGMISAFIGYVFCDVTLAFSGDFKGLIPVFVMLVSAVVMAICGLLAKKAGLRFMNDYALPISLVVGMASAIPFTAWLS